MGLPKEIAELVARFERNLDAYKSGQYNEMQLRQEFLDPSDPCQPAPYVPRASQGQVYIVAL